MYRGCANPLTPIPDWWIESAAQTLGFEAQQAETPYSDFERHLSVDGPGAAASPHGRRPGISRDSPQLARSSRPI